MADGISGIAATGKSLKSKVWSLKSGNAKAPEEKLKLGKQNAVGAERKVESRNRRAWRQGMQKEECRLQKGGVISSQWAVIGGVWPLTRRGHRWNGFLWGFGIRFNSEGAK